MFGMNDLTDRQSEILAFLRECKYRKETAPTYREIAGRFGFKSVRSAMDHICALEKKGYVRRHAGRSRGIELLFSERLSSKRTVSVPLLGDIPAGIPEEKTEFFHETLRVDRKLLGRSADRHLFALRVDGESMDGRGIHEGDWIVADTDSPPCEGDVVVALIDGQNTLKTLAQKKDRLFLKAESPGYSDWVPVEELMIPGVVRVVLRRTK